MPLMGLAALRRAGWLKVPVVGVITDYVVHPSWLHPGVDGYAVPHLDAEETVVDRLGDQVAVRVTGIPISADFRYPASGHRVRERWGWDARPRVLVNLGSYGMAVRKARRLVAAFDKLTPAAVLVLFTGRDEAAFQALTREATQHRDWVVRAYQENMGEWLSAVDVVVTPAGALTLTEVARLRRPLVIYQPRPGQELGNARWFQRQGAAVMAFSADEAREAVQQLLTQRDAAEQLTTRMAALVPTNAARQVVAFVEELMTSKGNKGANPSI
jgi:processive 1,2-diacylglycerol beta-glucosyltransferase